MIIYRHGRDCNCQNKADEINFVFLIICLIFIFAFVFHIFNYPAREIVGAHTNTTQSDVLVTPTVNVGITSVNP